MTLKKRLVIGDILDSYDGFSLLEGQYSVHQQKRVAVGEDLKDFFYIEQLCLIVGFRGVIFLDDFCRQIHGWIEIDYAAVPHIENQV